MTNGVNPLKFYQEPLCYTGLVSLISICLFVYTIVGSNAPVKLQSNSLIMALIFGGITYFMWDTRCPYCKRPFSKKEKVEWREDLGTRKEPYTYYSQVYRYSDGSKENVPGTKKTIMRDKKYDRCYYTCKKCEYGSEKEWKKEKSIWLGESPIPQSIKKGKNSNGNFGLNLFNDDTYEYDGNRKNIPKEVKKDLWIRHFGKKYFGNCVVCNKQIETHKFEAGHIKSVANGGSDDISNLKPICMGCNRSMGSMNLYHYKNKYYSKKS